MIVDFDLVFDILSKTLPSELRRNGFYRDHRRYELDGAASYDIVVDEKLRRCCRDIWNYS